MSEGRVTRASLLLDEEKAACVLSLLVSRLGEADAADEDAAGHLVSGRWTNAGSTGAAVCVAAARRILVASIVWLSMDYVSVQGRGRVSIA